MSEYVLRVEKLVNGYEVELCDPKISAENEKPKSAWKDPWVGYVCKDKAEVLKLVDTHLDTLKPPPGADSEYSGAFAEATKEED